MAVIEKRKAADGSVSYRVRIRRTGELPLSKTFTRRTDAQAWAREIEARADRGFAIPSREQVMRPLADAIDKWLEERLPELSPTDQTNSGNIARWWRAELGQVSLTRLDPETIEQKRNKLRDEKDAEGNPVRSASRVNRYLSVLSRILGYAERTLRWIGSNPCKAVKRFKEPDGRVRFLTQQEVEKLLAAVDSRVDRNGQPKRDFQLFVRVALFTGARRGEVAGLEWRDIDLRHNRITFRNTKNGTDRTVPLPAVLADAITVYGKVRPLDPTARLFPHNFRFDWREVQDVLPDFRFHDTRHNVASQLAMSGASLLDIATVTGHKTLAMVKRYSHLSDDHVRERLEQAAAKIAPKKP
ncbi:MAG: site-specific integrase [Anaerolineae bacterium]|nr:site-specific integrase [Anaerolineae bacterium]